MATRDPITAATCRSCGACCIAVHAQDGFCDLTSEDEVRLGRRFVRLHVLRPHPLDQLTNAIDGRYSPYGVIETKWRRQATGPLKGWRLCACAALRGSVLSKVSCSVYEKRPSVCRTAVKPGDRACRAIRAAFNKRVVDSPR